MKDKFTQNNFDLIRLAAALQVASFHGISHLQLQDQTHFLLEILKHFPGVPVFFFVSGFLISKSYEKNSKLAEYATNRALRIFPALIFCTVLSILATFLTGYFEGKDIRWQEFGFWIFSQISFLQFYNPEFMRGYGTGVLNGSLWTISVEIQFYVLIPILYTLLKSELRSRSNLILIALISISLCFNIARNIYYADFSEALPFKLFGVSFLPWVYMFLVGVLFQRNFERIHSLLSGKFWIVLPLYLVFSILMVDVLKAPTYNSIFFVHYLALASLVFTFAYSHVNLSRKILRKTDLSYGIYIYHIPVINFLIYYDCLGETRFLSLTIVCSAALASLSWFLVERPSVRLKRHPMHPVSS